jgi:hypothetical protein
MSTSEVLKTLPARAFLKRNMRRKSGSATHVKQEAVVQLMLNISAK